MKRFALSACLVAIATAAAGAGETGIPVCDDFLTKYEACITTKIPTENQTMFKLQLDQVRERWGESSKDPNTRPHLEASCKQVYEQMKTAMKPYGCAF